MHYIPRKGYFESCGKPVGSKRKYNLTLAKSCGYQGDLESFTRLVIEARINRQLLNEQYRLGAAMKAKEQEAA